MCGNYHRGQQLLGVRVDGMVEYLVTRTGLHHRAEIHDDNALTLPAGEFMRVAVHRAHVHAADLQYLRDPVVHVRLRGEPVFEQRLADGPPDGHSRVQHTVRVLPEPDSPTNPTASPA